MSLLIIHCPVNPRTLSKSEAEDLDFAGPEESFRWCLAEVGNAADIQILREGHGTLADLPFAEDALVLVPTVDVRLVHTRVPLITGRKLDALLPTLCEPHLLDQRTALRYQILPPIVGIPGTERTIAVTSESWMGWLHTQLSLIPVRRLTLIPDCFLLAAPTAGSTSSEFLIDSIHELRIIATREGLDWGTGWIELEESTTQPLPSTSNETALHTWSWSWVVSRALAWKAEKLAINLIQQVAPKRKEKNRKAPTARWKPSIPWALWRTPLKLTVLVAAVYLVGGTLYLGTLQLSNWRWQKTLEETAKQVLISPVSNSTEAIPAFIKQATNRIHAQGKTTPADFVPMASKLQSLLSPYPSGLLDEITFQTGSLSFSLKNSPSTPDSKALFKRAIELELTLTQSGKNQYRLMPYSGLVTSPQAGQP